MNAQAWRVLACVLLAGIPGTAAAQEVDGLRLSGEVRLRGEALRSAADQDHEYTLLRSRLGLEARLAEGAKVFVQVQDARTFGEETSTTDADANLFDLHQGWIELTKAAGGVDLALRAGRQELLLGNERLVGPVGWSNQGRSFDGLRLTVGRESAGWQVTGFAATVAERGPRTEDAQDEVAQADHTFLGLYGDARLIDGWFLFDRGAAYRTFTGVDRATAGGRVELPALGAVTGWLEASYQFGNLLGGVTEEQRDIAAYLLGGRVALGLPSSPLSSIGLGVDYLSGDEDPGDGEYRAFNTLYHTGHKWYGYLDLFLDPAARTGDRGLIDGIVSATLSFAENAPLSIDVHRFWTAEQRAVTIVGEPAERESGDLGWEFDVTLPVALARNQRLQLGYSAYRNGEAAPLVGLGRADRWWHWGYVMLTVGFSGDWH